MGFKVGDYVEATLFGGHRWYGTILGTKPSKYSDGQIYYIVNTVINNTKYGFIEDELRVLSEAEYLMHILET